jgi:hypothetical protein
MGNFCLTDEYPEAKIKSVTDNEKPRPMGDQGVGPIRSQSLAGNASPQILSSESLATIPGLEI